MRGYLVKKGARYYAVVYEGTDPLTRKERRTWRAAGTSRREAERFLAELVQARNSRCPVFPGRMSLASYLVDHWLPARRSSLRRSTFARYERETLRHINPLINHMTLSRVTAAELDALYDALLDHGRVDGTGLAPKTVLNIHQIGGARSLALRRPPQRGSRAFGRRRRAAAGDSPRTARSPKFVVHHHLLRRRSIYTYDESARRDVTSEGSECGGQLDMERLKRKPHRRARRCGALTNPLTRLVTRRPSLTGTMARTGACRAVEPVVDGATVCPRRG
jgi:hypothetical protein